MAPESHSRAGIGPQQTRLSLGFGFFLRH